MNLLRAVVAVLLGGLFAGPAMAADADTLVFNPGPVEQQKGPFSVGIYGGELYKSPFISFFYAPTDIHLSPSYLVALNFDYRFYQFKILPLAFEGEFDVDKRFGNGEDAWEFAVAPFVRWTWFPWNDLVYTNARLGIVGLSYVTSITPFERQNSGNLIGSNILHFLVPELTFAPSAKSPFEAFVRIHHRSGVFGLFNGVRGGSNYLSGGVRAYW